jgi:hypothetical protein
VFCTRVLLPPRNHPRPNLKQARLRELNDLSAINISTTGQPTREFVDRRQVVPGKLKLIGKPR